MKKYSAKAYYNYAKRLMEGEATSEAIPEVDNEFKTLVKGAGLGAGGVGAVACLTYLSKHLHIQDVSSASFAMRGWANKILQSTESGFFSRMIAHVASGIAKISHFVIYQFYKLTNKIEVLGKPIFEGGSATYGSVFMLAIFAALFGAILYKIYKVIRTKKSATETTESFNKRQRRLMNKALNESTKFTDALNALTESDLSETMSGQKIIDKNSSVVDEMWASMTASTGRIMAGIFLPIWSWLFLMVAICKGLLECWRGLKRALGAV